MDLKAKAASHIRCKPVADFIIKLLNTMPPGVESASQFDSAETDSFLIYSGDPCDIVIILLEGTIRIENELQNGILYTIDKVEPPHFIGAAECFADIPLYRGSIVCETRCFYISIPSDRFMEWMKASNSALFTFTTNYVKTIIRQVSKDRTFLFFPGEIRLAYQFIHYFETQSVDGVCTLKIPRHQLADETRISVKTVNRCINKMKKKNVISQHGHYISINQKQYELLSSMIEEAEL